MSDTHFSRRKFFKTAAAAGAPLVLPNFLSAASPNGKLNHAAVGVDGQGWSDLTSIASHPGVNVAAICDVDTSRLAKAIEKFPQARRYQDWREMLETEGDKIDSVQVSIPDHMHAPVSIAAMERGKHVYCEKPLTHEVAEARAMRLAAEKARSARTSTG
jgi:predicted dehydrogenase